jgi:hypothetical protein
VSLEVIDRDNVSRISENSPMNTGIYFTWGSRPGSPVTVVGF